MAKQRGFEPDFDEMSGDVADPDAPKGAAAPQVVANQVLEMKQWLKQCFDFRRNLMTGNVEFRRATAIRDSYQVVLDHHENSIMLAMMESGFRAVKGTVPMIIQSEWVPDYHPLREYFRHIERDGPTTTGNIEQLVRSLSLSSMPDTVIAALKVLGFTPEKAVATLLRRWLIAACAGAVSDQPNHVCLVLQGPQGAFKTTWLRGLCPSSLADYNYVGQIMPMIQNGHVNNLVAEKWFVNIDDELEQLFGKDFNTLKSFITLSDVTNRKAYAKYEKRRKRVCSWMASVNGERILRDLENRRYFIMPVKRCLTDAMPPIDALWAEVYRLVLAGEQHWFTVEEYKLITAINEQFTEISAEAELLQRYFEPARPSDDKERVWYLTATEILTELRRYTNNMNIGNHQLGRALKRYGFESKSRRRSGRGEQSVPEYCYACLRYDVEGRPMMAPHTAPALAIPRTD